MSGDDGSEIVAACLKERGIDADALQDGERIKITAPRTGYGFYIGINHGVLYVCKKHDFGLHSPNSLDKAARLLKYCIDHYGKFPQHRTKYFACNGCK
jgi:hypothetical protein